MKRERPASKHTAKAHTKKPNGSRYGDSISCSTIVMAIISLSLAALFFCLKVSYARDLAAEMPTDSSPEAMKIVNLLKATLREEPNIGMAEAMSKVFKERGAETAAQRAEQQEEKIPNLTNEEMEEILAAKGISRPGFDAEVVVLSQKDVEEYRQKKTLESLMKAVAAHEEAEAAASTTNIVPRTNPLPRPQEYEEDGDEFFSNRDSVVDEDMPRQSLEDRLKKVSAMMT